MSISYVQATWTATTLDEEFDHYEIERTENATDFFLVAEITTEAVTEYRDYEPQRGGSAGYRLRVVRIDGAKSDWTAVQTELIPSADLWAFTSNEAPDLNVEFQVWSDEQKAHTWKMPRNQKEYAIAGRDGAIVLRGVEDPLDQFTLNIVVTGQSTDGVGRRIAEPFEAIAKEDLAYVCVHSPDDDRWLANVIVDEMEQEEGGQVYTLPAAVRELTEVPSVVDVAVV